MMAASKTEDYQLLGEVLDQGLKELGYSREDLSVELFASDKQHVLDLYCSKGQNCSYKFYWPSFGMAYGNPRFSELGKVWTKVALERSRMVLCSPDWGAHGANEYWRTLLDRLTISSVRLPDDRDADSQRIQFEFAEFAANSFAARIRCEFGLKFLVLRIRGEFALRNRGRRQNDHACAVFSPNEKFTLNYAMQ